MTDASSKLAKSIEEMVDRKVEKAISKRPSTVLGKVTGRDGEGKIWVRIAGADQDTPVRNTAVEVRTGDTVKVTIGDGKATIDSNITNPAAGITTVVNVQNIANEAFQTASDGTVLIKSLEADTAKIHDLTADTIHATTGYFDDLHAKNITADHIESATAYIGDLTADNITTGNIKATTGYIGELKSKNITTDNIDAATGYIGSLVSNDITANDIVAAHEAVESLDATYAKIETLESDYAHITNGVIDNAKIGYADVEALDANYASINLANVNNAYINNGTFNTAAIVDEQVLTVEGNKATIKEINAANINVVNLNAKNLTVETADGYVTIGDKKTPTKEFLDSLKDELQAEIDGAIETFTVDHVPHLNDKPASDWTTDKERAKHVGDVCYVVNDQIAQNGYCYRFTLSDGSFSWQLIKDSDVTAALSRLQTAEGKIGTIETFDEQIATFKTEAEGNISTLMTKTTELETSLGDKVSTATFNEVKQAVDENSATITSMSETLETKADSSTVTTLSNTVNSVKQTATSNNSHISQLVTTLGTNADGTTKAGDIVHRVSDVTQDLDSFKSTVASTYATAERVTQDETKINQTATAIGLTASGGATIANPNLSPYFEYLPLTNKSAGSPYWYYLNDFTAMEDGWAKGVKDNSSGSSNTYINMREQAIDALKPSTTYTAMLEVRNYSGSGTTSWVIPHRTDTGQVSSFAAPKSVAINKNGVYRLTLTSLADLSGVTEGCSAYIQVNAGAKISLECRMSLYEGEYTGPWKPYSGSQLYASQAELKIANDNISSKVSKTDYTGATVASLINQSADSVKIQAKHVEIDGTTTFKDGSTSTTVADYVQGKVDDVTVGGRNLLAYSGLGRNWVYSSFADGVYTRATTATSESFITGSTVAPLELGETYTFSAWMKTNGQVASVEMFLYDNAGKTVRSKNLGGLTTDWKLYSWTVTMPDSWTSGTNTTQPWHARFDNNGSKTSGTNAILYVKGPKLEKGTKATDWTAAPEDVASNTQRIYYRSNSTTAPAAPTTWVTSTATANSTWSTKRMQYDATYKYLYTCVQMQNAAGMVYCTTVLLDDTTTVIDGGSIITGTVTANQLNASDINASKMLTVGSMATAVQARLGMTVTTVSDFNDYKTTGTYYIKVSGNTNAPTTGHGTLEVVFDVGTPYQIWQPDSTSTAYYKRKYASSTWSSWTTIDGKGAYDLANTANNKANAWRGTLSTDGSTAAKAVVCDGFTSAHLVNGTTISVYCGSSGHNVAGALTLNVQSTGAKPIYVAGAATSDTNRLYWTWGCTLTFTYDGSNWRLSDNPPAMYAKGYESSTVKETCETAEGTAQKNAMVDSFVCFKGATMSVPMKNSNTSTSMTIKLQNSSGTGFTANVYHGSSTNVPTKGNGLAWPAGEAVIFTYDGKFWRTGNQTFIDGGNVVTGKVGADHIDVSSIAIGNLNGGSTVVSNASAGKTASDKLGTTLEPISGARGNESTVTYVELCKGTIACNSNGASGSIHISGQIGGYVNTNQGHVDVTIGNRGTPPYAIAGQKDSTIDTTRGNIVAYYDSSYIVHVYLVMSATYCRYTLNMDNAIEFTRVNTTSTTAPSGTKFFDLSTATTEDSRTATDYITAIDSNGIRVHAASNPTSNYAKINADGMDVVKGGASVASFGEIARVGSEDSSRFVAAPSNMSMILASGAKVVDISSDGDEETISVEKMISSNRVPKGETGTRSVIVSDIPSWATTIMVLITDGSGNRSKRFASITSSLDFTYQNMRVVWTPSTKKIDYSLSTANNKTWTQAEVIVSGTKANISPTYLLGYGESTGAYSFVEGYGNTASGKYSHAEGLSTTASKPATHAEGYYTSATSDYAHSEGTHTEATGFASHAEGYYCQAKGTHSHAQNTDTIAASSDQTAIGKYNVSDAADTYALIVGNGTSDTARSNAMTVAWDGTLGLAKALPIASGGTGITNFLTTKDTNGPMTSVASATWTTLHSVSLEKGSWLVLVRCYCVSASGGTRQFTFSSSSSASAASFGESITIPAGTPGYQIYPMFVSPTATTTYYLRGYQSSGAALNMRGGFKAIKLG